MISPSFYGSTFTSLFVAAMMVDRSTTSATNGNHSGIPDVDCETVSTEKNIHPIENSLFSLNDRWFSTAFKKHCAPEITRSSKKSAAGIAF